MTPRAIDAADLLLARRKERIDQVVAQRVRGLTLVVEQVHDPHNLAAVLRTSEGLGLQDLHVVASPKGFRPNQTVTQGADKWLDLHRHPTASACAEDLRSRGFRIHGSRLDGEAVDLAALPFGERLALVFGNEHSGLTPEFAALCDGFFRIPMLGFSQSFNISVAVGITLATAMQERRRRGLGGDLAEDDREALRRRFYALASRAGRIDLQRAGDAGSDALEDGS
jgi:tRNA (guanosine-2'-O-)-methyltransferase